MGLPPCGGSGLKFLSGGDSHRCSQSPSMRREWIEIVGLQSLFFRHGSPSMRREWIEMIVPRLTTQTTGSLPPCGGSGLKSVGIV